MEETIHMYVTKRDGRTELLSYDKIVQRTKQVGEGLNIQYSGLVMKIMDQLYNHIPTTKIDELMAEQCASMGVHHYDYSSLASRLIISNHQKEVNSSILECINKMSNQTGYLSKNITNIWNPSWTVHVIFLSTTLDSKHWNAPICLSMKERFAKEFNICG